MDSGRRLLLNIGNDRDNYILESQIVLNGDNEGTEFAVSNEMEQIQENIAHNHQISCENEELRSLLDAWSLGDLYTDFIANKVDLEILKCLKRSQIERLIKKYPFGTQVLLENHLEEWRESIGLPIIENTNYFNRNIVQQIPSTQSSPTSSIRYSPYPRPDTPGPSITIADILNETAKGAMITHYYNTVSKLQDDQRNILINTVCQYFVDKNIKMTLPMSHRLEEEICERFPTEKLDFYRSGSRGKLYNRYSNLKTTFKPINVPNAVQSDEVILNIELVPEIDAECCERSLKFDKLSVEEFDRIWQACANYRILDITKLNSTIAVFEKWPFYKQPSGYRLIDMDFSVLFPESPGILIKWPQYNLALKNFVLAEGNIKDKTILSFLTKLRDSSIPENNYNAILLWALHGYLVPTQKTVSRTNTGQKSVTKFTIKESQESFIYIGKTVQELEEHLQFLATKQNTIQPFILAVGSNVAEISDTFVYFDGVRFEFSNILRALDIVYKIFHLFNLEYPIAATNFYYFVQELFYSMKVTKIKNTKINVLLNEIR